MLPILVMTGWATIETAVEAMRRGANGFIQKPWDDIALVRLVQREIDESRAAERADEGRRRELDEARAIQRALLPATVPDLAGCRIAAQWTPASGLGGDCYDLLPFDNSGLGLSIADVIGKGIPAALLMANLQAATRAFATSLATPADVCASVNRLLCRNIAPGKFASFFYSVVDARRATLTYANAGHFAPVLVHADGRWNRLRSTGPVLGVLPNATFQPESVRLERGDRLVCFTDGITEAISPSGDEFGESRLIELACRHRFDPPETLIAAVMASVRAWTNGPAHDDATVAVVAID